MGGGELAAAVGTGDEASIAAPHLLQNLIPGAMLAPQELQNAISHLIGIRCRGVRESISQIEAERD